MFEEVLKGLVYCEEGRVCWCFWGKLEYMLREPSRVPRLDWRAIEVEGN